MKYKKGKIVIEDNHENNRSIYIREGFVEVKQKPKTQLAKAE